jgi:4'-phosphopantetheinyl transferase EntD
MTRADQVLIEALQAPPALIGLSPIMVGDEAALRPDELVAFQSAVTKVRRQSGAVRIVARALLERLGEAPASLPRSITGAPAWPAGIVGSLAHDETMAAAAVARAIEVSALGIDIEPNQPLPDDLVTVVATPSERRSYRPELLGSRRLFVAKEAVFKATFPLDAVFLDFHDVEVDFDAGVATTGSGQRLGVDVREAGDHLVALAHIVRSAPSDHSADDRH